MDSNAGDPLAGGLIHIDHLVLVWRPLPDLPPAAALAEANRSAAALLALLGGLDEPAPPLDEPSELLAHLHRLDHKLDLMLDLLGQWLNRDLALPQPQPLRLSARGVVWLAEPVPPAGPGWISLYLRPGLPKPLELPALLQPLDDGSVLAEFQGLDQAVTDGLERFVFRCHRRAVAQARRPSPAP